MKHKKAKILGLIAGIFIAVILSIYCVYNIMDSIEYRYVTVNPIMIEILGDYNMSLNDFGCEHNYEYWCINWNKEHNKTIPCWEKNGVLS